VAYSLASDKADNAPQVYRRMQKFWRNRAKCPIFVLFFSIAPQSTLRPVRQYLRCNPLQDKSYLFGTVGALAQLVERCTGSAKVNPSDCFLWRK